VRPGVLVDVLISGPVIAGIGPALASRGEREVHGAGGALLPGLHDHHCHVLATAAAAGSVLCGPPGVTTAAGLAAALRAAALRAAALRAAAAAGCAGSGTTRRWPGRWTGPRSTGSSYPMRRPGSSTAGGAVDTQQPGHRGPRRR
jgi:cytosine/adenosine deaminase-related metal-dependent hydrolase